MDAVLPLIGVVIGAVIGAAMTFLLDRRRERRAARACVRLVVDELQGVRSTWQSLAEAWSKAPTAETADWVISNLQGQPLSTVQWKHAQELLAASLSDDDWTALAEAYRVVVLVNEVAQTPQADERLELPGIMNDAGPYLDRAVARLQHWSGPPPGPWRSTRTAAAP
jgi:gas vesicle protein